MADREKPVEVFNAKTLAIRESITADSISQRVSTGLIIGTANTKKIGFYNTTPVAQQTGIAVTAAAIHAALVNLGLITA